MNCVSENCKYVKVKDIRNDDLEYFKSVLVPYCQLGRSVSYPFIDDGKDLRCDCYVRAGSEDRE